MPAPLAMTTRPRTAADARPLDRIVVPVQGSDREFLAQQCAVEMAAALGLPVRALHVAPPVGDRDDAPFRFLAAECAKWNVRLDARAIRGTDVAREILEELAPRDLVVIGTRRLVDERYHVGSVALELVRRAPCPVQVVRLD